jgi:class 3 adenylate cyclase
MDAVKPTVQNIETEPEKRKLAIVFGDIAGTALLVSQAGDFFVANALRQFFGRLENFQTTHHARFVKTVGDGFMAVFEDLSDAFAFAVSLQQSLTQDPITVERAAESPARPHQLSLRVSLHIGSVLVMKTSYGEEVFGADVNVAARLSSFAKPGEIVVSGLACHDLPARQQAILKPAEAAAVQIKGMTGQFEFRTVDFAGAQVHHDPS